MTAEQMFARHVKSFGLTVSSSGYKGTHWRVNLWLCRRCGGRMGDAIDLKCCDAPDLVRDES